MQFEQELKEKTAEVEALLERMLPEEEGLQKTIFSAMRYSLMAGGKNPPFIDCRNVPFFRRYGYCFGRAFYGSD